MMDKDDHPIEKRPWGRHAVEGGDRCEERGPYYGSRCCRKKGHGGHHSAQAGGYWEKWKIVDGNSELISVKGSGRVIY